MERYKFTLIGLSLAFVIFFITLIFKIDFFEIIVETLLSFERYEVDEFIIPLLIVFIFSYFDLTKWKRSQKIEYEKIKIYKAMLASTHHILKDFLNQMKLFKLTAEDTPDFDAEVLSLYDVVMEDALTQLEALGSLSKLDETSIHDSVKPK